MTVMPWNPFQAQTTEARVYDLRSGARYVASSACTGRRGCSGENSALLRPPVLNTRGELIGLIEKSTGAPMSEAAFSSLRYEVVKFDAKGASRILDSGTFEELVGAQITRVDKNTVAWHHGSERRTTTFPQ